jgi:hypothetical protein
VVSPAGSPEKSPRPVSWGDPWRDLLEGSPGRVLYMDPPLAVSASLHIVCIFGPPWGPLNPLCTNLTGSL